MTAPPLVRKYVWLDDLLVAVIDRSSGTANTYFVAIGFVDEPLLMTDVVKATVQCARRSTRSHRSRRAAPRVDGPEPVKDLLRRVYRRAQPPETREIVYAVARGRGAS